MDTTILLMDNDILFRKGLRSSLEDEDDLHVVGEAGVGQAAFDLVRELSPNIVVLDVSTPGVNGAEATRHILAESPRSSVIAISVHSEKPFVRDVLQAGASGYISRENAPEELLQCLRAVTGGEAYLSPAITDVVASDHAHPASSGRRVRPAEDAILHTKFQRPLPPRDYVYRPRLANVLEDGSDMPLTLVSAPAGYGKSCLVSSWLETCNCQTAWLSLDQNDNDPRTFFFHFVAAVQTIFPDALADTLTNLRAPRLPGSRELAATLVNELDGIEERFVLVMDDFHFVRDRSILEVFDEMLRHPPRNARFVLIGRKDPSLPVASLRAQGQMSEIRVQDLMFTMEETASFLRHVLEDDVARATAEGWTEKTEGWVSGLRLAVLSMHHRKDAENVLAQLPLGAQYIREYLFNEVVSQQPPAILDFLLRMSIVERFCAPLCDALCPESGASKRGHIGSSERLSMLNRDNMFVINLDHEGRWFRFHHMFREMLAAEMERHFSPVEIAQLHSRASAWFAENGFTEDAIRHALRAGDEDAAVQLYEENRRSVLSHDRWFVRERWLSMFPEELIHRRAELLVALMWSSLFHFDVARVPALIDETTRLLEGNSGSDSLRGEVEFFLGFVHIWRNESARGLAHLENALKMVPESYAEVRAHIEAYYAPAHQMRGDGQWAIDRIHDLLQKHSTDSVILRSRLLTALTYTHILAGDLPDALMANRMSYDFATNNDCIYSEAWDLYLRGLIHYYQNDLAQSIIDFQEIVERRYILQTRAVVDAMVGLAVAFQARGECEMACKTVEGLLGYVVPLTDPGYVLIARSCQARLAIMEGKLDTATSWLQQGLPPAGYMFVWLDNPIITYCRSHLAEGSAASIEASVANLQGILQTSRDNHNVCQMIHIMPLLALAYEKQGRVNEAHEMLQNALEMARPGGWIRPFVEPGVMMASLLKQLPKTSGSADQINTILAAIDRERKATGLQSGQDDASPSADRTPVSTSPVDALTYREQEVLELLAQRLYNKEIADTLSVSLATIETHVKHIFQKLEVNNRRDAVAKASELGLLSDREKSKT